MSTPIVVEAKGLLFDMDGVLISSIGSVVRSWRRWAGEYNLPNAEAFEMPHGVRARDVIATTAPHLNVEEALQRIEQIELDDMDDLRVLPGVEALVSSLSPERWAIVTSATRRLLLGRLRWADLPLPGVIVSADDVVNGKPDPEPYRRGAELIHTSPADCIVVEDAPNGVQAGKAAGIRVLGVLGTSSVEDLRAAGADWVVASLQGVSAICSDSGFKLSFDTV